MGILLLDLPRDDSLPPRCGRPRPCCSSGHSGSWVAELDHPGINYWLKARLLAAIPPGEYAAFWLGGRATGRHSEHQPGEWKWDHMNTTIEWFDWWDGQPDNYEHHEMCLTLWEQHDPFFPIARNYK